MAADFVLEACVDSLDSALAAKEGGATRLELCANLLIGGTTPMPSLVRRVKAATGLPTHALLRPRFGDFLYTGEEFSLLLEDAAALLEAGADAIVSGFLTPAGDLDRQRLAQLVELCHRAGKRFTLHRAFDMCRDPFAALERAETGTGVTVAISPAPEETLTVLCNFHDGEAALSEKSGEKIRESGLGELLISNYKDVDETKLCPYEARMYLKKTV